MTVRRILLCVSVLGVRAAVEPERVGHLNIWAAGYGQRTTGGSHPSSASPPRPGVARTLAGRGIGSTQEPHLPALLLGGASRALGRN